MTIEWQEVIKATKEQLGVFRQEGFKPTLRTMFYRLYSLGLVPNTKQAYKKLSSHTVEARWLSVFPKEGYVSLSLDCFADNSREVVGDFNEVYWTPQELIDARINQLQDTGKDYTDYIPRWHNQSNYVEVWLEKDAMVGTFQSILRGLEVRIVPMKGFASMSFLYETVKRLRHYRYLGKSIHILYYGDFDPSGDYMDTDLLNRMARMQFNVTDLDGTFERIAVTPEQIEEHDLPYDPDEETSDKMDGDPRTNGFLEKYGKLYAVELDALPALIPDVFRDQLVIDKVEDYYDEDIYDELKDKYDSEDVLKMLKTSVKKLARSV